MSCFQAYKLAMSRRGPTVGHEGLPFPAPPLPPAILYLPP